MNEPSALARHHAELARANAAALQQNFQEAVEIASELLTSGVYAEIAQNDPEVQTRLLQRLPAMPDED